MRISLFCHSLLSDWNHGNAHFLRGVVTELVERGHRVKVYEAANAWSPSQLAEQYGSAALLDAQRQYPALDIQRYAESDLDLETAIGDSELAIVHEWTPHDLVSRIGAVGKRLGCRLLFHDTHHRAVTAPEEMRRYDLSAFDGVLAFGEVLRQIYLSRNWAERVWTWHEAADVRVFKPLPEISPERDLVWVGNWGDDERVRELQEFLIDPIARLNSSARVHGVRYPESALASLARANIEYAGWLPNYRVPDAFARARVTVHVPRNPYVIALPGIPTIRPFEALACGIPLICSPWQDAEGLFRAGKDYLLARDGREMTEMLRLLLNEPEAARELALHGRNTVLARHTCAHRVDELLSICRELGLNTQVASGALEPESTRAPVEVARANLRVAPDLGIQVRPAECAVGLRLVLPSDPRRQARISRVLAEFPAIRVEFSPFDAPVDPALTLEVFEWARRDCDLVECDRIAAHAADSSAWLSLRGADLAEDVL
ncbi:MAG TPA: glycosyltransferase, partial [Polyangiaceae bacterium]|nr:glycosyltransferase [Polyangiaceae bacterium]